MRSGYISSWCGDALILESYSLYRFGQQFGFYQDIPNDIGGMPPAATLNNHLYYFRVCTRHNTLSQVFLPARKLEPRNHVTSQYRNWWLSEHGSYFDDNIHQLVSNAIPPPSQPRLPKNKGANQGGKQLRLIEEAIRTSQDNDVTHAEESHSSTSDHHWKRPP